MISDFWMQLSFGLGLFAGSFISFNRDIKDCAYIGVLTAVIYWLLIGTIIGLSKLWK